MRRLRLTDQSGFTLIEVMVAAVVLMVGVMGALALLDRANATATTTASREAATSLVRDLIEASRSVPYEDLNSGALDTRLQALPGLAKSKPGPTYTIVRRNTTYTIADSVCTMDDAKDGGGSRPSGLTFCPQSVAANTASPVKPFKPDRNPEDYKLVTVTASWTHDGVTRSVTQTGAVNNPASATGPSVTSLFPDGYGAPYVVTTDTPAATIDIGTSSKATAVSWSIDGSDQASTPTATDGTGLVWTVPWTIHPVDGAALDDGPYLVEAHAFNQYGVSGPGRSETVTLNRFPPRAPTHVAGGRNATGGVDIEWDANTERDIIGYEVTRLDGNGATRTVICSRATQKLSTSCTDPAPPSLADVHYVVQAFDTAPGTGQPRASADSAKLDVTTTDTPPFAPISLAATHSGGTTTLTWQRPSPSDPDSGDSIAFYRIYRDGVAAADRYDRWYATGSSLSWDDTTTGGTQHVYYVSAVDQHFGESAPVGPVTG